MSTETDTILGGELVYPQSVDDETLDGVAGDKRAAIADACIATRDREWNDVVPVLDTVVERHPSAIDEASSLVSELTRKFIDLPTAIRKSYRLRSPASPTT